MQVALHIAFQSLMFDVCCVYYAAGIMYIQRCYMQGSFRSSTPENLFIPFCNDHVRWMFSFFHLFIASSNLRIVMAWQHQKVSSIHWKITLHLQQQWHVKFFFYFVLLFMMYPTGIYQFWPFIFVLFSSTHPFLTVDELRNEKNV